MIGETYHDFGEAMIALDCIKKYGKGKQQFASCMHKLGLSIEYGAFC